MKTLFVFLKILFLDDLFAFLDFWFYHLPRQIFQKTIDLVYSLDAEIGIKAHFRQIFKPFYGAKGFILLVASLPFRLGIILFGTLFYSLIFLGAFLITIFLLFLPLLGLLAFISLFNHAGIYFRK